QLERAGGDLLAGLGHADDDRLAPAAVAGLQRLAHDGGVAGAVEGVVGPAVGEGHEVGDDVAPTTFLGDLLRVDEVGHAEAAAPLLLAVVDVHADDLVGADHLQALDHVEADAAEAEHHAVGARLDLGGVDHSADAGGDAAADVAGLVEGGVGADLGQG